MADSTAIRKVVVFDRKRENVEALAAQGAAIAPNARTLAMEADVTMSCLFNDDAVKEVYGGDDGVVLSATEGNIILEMSTIAPETSRELWRMGQIRGIEVLETSCCAQRSTTTPRVNKDFHLVLEQATATEGSDAGHLGGVPDEPRVGGKAT